MKKKSDAIQYPQPTSPSAVAAQFGVVPISAHAHTGADAQQIDYSNVLNTPSVVTIYGGVINSGGASGTLPSGWSVSKVGTGDYLVTHNLGYTTYVVVPTTYTYTTSMAGQTSTTFEIYVTNLSGTAVDANVNFILLKI